MTDLSKQSELLQGLEDSWRVTEVDLSREEQKVAIRLEADPRYERCCECGPERSRRHWDTMQFETLLTAQVPRTKCPNCGVKMCVVPWAKSRGRLALLFEAFAIRVLQATARGFRNFPNYRTRLLFFCGKLKLLPKNGL